MLYGMSVKVTLETLVEKKTVMLRNVTEIHYNFETSMPKPDKNTVYIAFESDVHSTGTIYCMDNVKEFEVFQETEVAESFD